MDLNQHIEKIVESIIAEISANITVKVDSVISNAINNRLNSFDYSTFIKEAATVVFEKRVADYQIDQRKLESRIAEKITATIDQVHNDTAAVISKAVDDHIAGINFNQSMTDAVGSIIADRLKEFAFPDKSIAASALNFENFKISGDIISGGIIEHFSSTGIDDRATNVALTILDDNTVVENNLLTKDLTVEGSLTINGEFVVNGKIPTDSPFYSSLITDVSTSALEKLDRTLFNNYSTIIFNDIKQNGLDLSKITVNGNEVIVNGRLGNSITESNLQKIGQLKELQVSGESLLSETLYTTNKRVGINTIEPSAALTVWDDEVEITVSKKQKDTASINTPRNQRFILSSNSKDNLTLDVDGSVKIDDLRVGSMRFTVSASAPNYLSERGHVVWNSNPNLGGPVGWICLGGANWANFGIID